jgi:hypothetical protein
MATLQMRCIRVSVYDSGGQTVREVNLVSSDRTGQPINPTDQVQSASMTCSFIDPNGSDIVYDSVFDVAITAAALTRQEEPAALETKQE